MPTENNLIYQHLWVIFPALAPVETITLKCKLPQFDGSLAPAGPGIRLPIPGQDKTWDLSDHVPMSMD